MLHSKIQHERCDALLTRLTLYVAVVTASSQNAGANETDQFLIPPDTHMADLGEWISRTHYEVLVRVTERVNRDIDAARRQPPNIRDARLKRLQDPGVLADGIRDAFGPGFFETIGFEDVAGSRTALHLFPGQVTKYKRADWIYQWTLLPIDPRNLPLLVQSSTIKVYGVYLGTDKLGHFHDLGHYYYNDYRRARAKGMSQEAATQAVVQSYSSGLISETGGIGLLSTGVCSNADMVSNLMGLKFYQNLSESVKLKGVDRAPLCTLVGGYWKLNMQVRPDTALMEPFVSDHWNEALNPSALDPGMRSAVRRRLCDEAANVIALYCDGDGRPRTATYFVSLADQLATYYGEAYGHVGNTEDVLSIGNTCFPALASDAERDGRQATPSKSADAQALPAGSSSK